MPIELNREEEAIVASMDAHNRERFEGTVRAHLEHFSPHEEGEPLIRSTPGVVGGDDCVRRTRIPVWMLVAYKKSGESDADLLRNYPGLTAEDLAAAWAFYAANTERVDAQRRRQEEAD